MLDVLDVLAVSDKLKGAMNADQFKTMWKDVDIELDTDLLSPAGR